MEQIRGLEDELEINYKVTKNIITEKILLENKMSNFDKFEYEEKIEKLKLDLKRSKVLLKDAQKQLALGNYHFLTKVAFVHLSIKNFTFSNLVLVFQFFLLNQIYQSLTFYFPEEFFL